MKKLLLFLAVLYGIYSNAQSILKTMQLLPDTGQVGNYTATFGEDNDYSINTLSYQINGDGTVTDLVTGLMWQQTDGGEMTIENAIAYCNSLTLGGYTDWRLPSPMESFSILNEQNVNPAISTNYFTLTAADYWWTNLFQFGDNSKVWVTNGGGGIGNVIRHTVSTSIVGPSERLPAVDDFIDDDALISEGGGGGYKPCSGKYVIGCMSESIKQVQGCLGLVQDGKYGNKTKAALTSVGFPNGFTDADVAKICKTSNPQKKEVNPWDSLPDTIDSAENNTNNSNNNNTKTNNYTTPPVDSSLPGIPTGDDTRD
jgi:hypothetical protein